MQYKKLTMLLSLMAIAVSLQASGEQPQRAWGKAWSNLGDKGASYYNTAKEWWNTPRQSQPTDASSGMGWGEWLSGLKEKARNYWYGGNEPRLEVKFPNADKDWAERRAQEPLPGMSIEQLDALNAALGQELQQVRSDYAGSSNSVSEADVQAAQLAAAMINAANEQYAARESLLAQLAADRERRARDASFWYNLGKYLPRSEGILLDQPAGSSYAQRLPKALDEQRMDAQLSYGQFE